MYRDSNASALSGIWLHRQQADDASSADDECAFSEEDDPDTAVATNIQQVESGCQLLARADIAVFDTLMSVTSTDVRTSSYSNVELLSVLTGDDDLQSAASANIPQCDGTACDIFTELWGHDEVDGTDGNDTLVADDGTVSATRPQTGCVIESGTGDLTMSPVHHTTNAGNAVQTASLRSTQTLVINSKRSLQQPWKSDTSSLTSNDETRYIVEAAQLISQAQEYEIAENYLASYSHYRSGIEILVKGVQSRNFRLRLIFSYKRFSFMIMSTVLCSSFVCIKPLKVIVWPPPCGIMSKSLE